MTEDDLMMLQGRWLQDRFEENGIAIRLTVILRLALF